MSRLLQYYYLFQAYDLLGARLFGRHWTGQEFSFPSMVAPDELAARRAPLKARVDEIDEQIASAKVRIGKTTKVGIIQSEEARVKGLCDERGRLHSQLWNMPEAGEGYRRDFEARSRHETTEARLFQAMKGGELQAHAGPGFHIPASVWNEGAKLYIEISLAKLPRKWSNMRRCSVLLPRAEFDEWREQVMPILADETNPASVELLVRDYAREVFARQEKPRRAEFIANLRKRFPELSARAAKRVWESEAPATLRQSGRPRRPRTSTR